MDREWSTSALGAGQVGWDWFALQLSDGSELMYYQLRLAGRLGRIRSARARSCRARASAGATSRATRCGSRCWTRGRALAAACSTRRAGGSRCPRGSCARHHPGAGGPGAAGERALLGGRGAHPGHERGASPLTGAGLRGAHRVRRCSRSACAELLLLLHPLHEAPGLLGRGLLDGPPGRGDDALGEDTSITVSPSPSERGSANHSSRAPCSV